MGVTHKLFNTIIHALTEGGTSVESFQNIIIRKVKDPSNPHLVFLKESISLSFPLLVVYKQDGPAEDDVFSKSYSSRKPGSVSIIDSTLMNGTARKDINNSNNESRSRLYNNDQSREAGQPKESGGSWGSPGLGGSPLKLQAIADLSITSPMSEMIVENEETKSLQLTKYGISLQMARTMASWMNELNQKTEQQMPQLVIFCDSNHITKTALLMIEYVSGFVKATRMTITGPLGDKSLKREFQSLNLSDKQLVYKAKYNITDKMVEGYPGLLMIEIEWSKSSLILPLEPPPTSSRTEIKAQVVLGKNVATHHLYKQLAVLKSLIEGLETAEVDWLVGDSDHPVIERLKELIQRLKLGDADMNTASNRESQENTTKTDGNEEFIACFDSIIQQERKDLDFTDHLWSILCQCSSHHELVECLKYAFTVLSNGELNPMVHRHNSTTMAEMVRESYSGKFRVPNLAGLYPLQLLAEIGVEKLRQDYVFTLLSKDLVTLGNLTPLVATSGTLKEKYDQLERLQAVVEMMVLLNLYLKIPYNHLTSCAVEMLGHYECNPVSSAHVFTFSVPSKLVKGELDVLRPCHWELEVTKRVQSMVQSMKYMLLTSQPFHHIQVETNIKCNGHSTSEDPEADNHEEICYYLVKKEETLNYML